MSKLSPSKVIYLNVAIFECCACLRVVMAESRDDNGVYSCPLNFWSTTLAAKDTKVDVQVAIQASIPATEIILVCSTSVSARE